MKSDVIQYERTYNLLKSRIECGILPVGKKLPGRSVLCKELGTSEKTVRRALELLEQDGFLETAPRKRPTVVSAFASPREQGMRNVKQADRAQVDDLLKTGTLLCYPFFLRGMHLCTGEDWHTPDMLLSNMDPEKPEEFWQLSSRIWRFFIARNENELLMRAVDGLGFKGKEPQHGSLEDRERYHTNIRNMFQTVKNGDKPKQADLEQIFSQYRIIAEPAGERQFFMMVPLCPRLAKAEGVGQQISLGQERYSSVCLDLLGLIAIGRYQPGDRLPTHDQLQEIYGVSRDTTVKAVRMLQDWGVVAAAPRRGISVEMNLEALKKIHITPEVIACHVRRYLDSLELLCMTVERTAAHGAAHMTQEDRERLCKAIAWQYEQPYEHQLIPRTMLDFITGHIQYDALRSIYQILSRNFSIGRSIPKLVSPDKNPRNISIYRQYMEAAAILAGGDTVRFAKMAADMYGQVRGLIITECRRLGYWDAAMQVYDGRSLWK